VTPEPAAGYAALQSEPGRFTLFAALRLLEQNHPDRPRLGDSRRPADDAVRLAQPPHLIFAPTDVAAFAQDGDATRPRLDQYSFGLFGPNGALPLHLTEYCYQRQRQLDDPSVTDFINVFQHRLIALFYRAWANSDPVTNLDRPASDRFLVNVGALIGLGTAAARERDPVIDYAKLHRAGHFVAQARSAEGLEQLLADYFELPIAVHSYSGEWLDIPPDSVCRLGGAREYATLGTNATLGASSWQCQHKFEIAVGPVSLTTFGDFLPGSRGLRELQALVRLYTSDEWSWQVRLLLRDIDVPGVQLGVGGQLAWTTWLGRREQKADDVVLQGDNRWLG
jgi:type VI secretion system protein ImpH